jgi:hypothetical protein
MIYALAFGNQNQGFQHGRLRYGGEALSIASAGNVFQGSPGGFS